MFADPKKNGNAASVFLNLLFELNIRDKDILFGSFDCNGSASRSEWRGVLGVRDRRHFDRWQVPFHDRDFVRPWLGIKPTFGPEVAIQSPGLFGFRYLMVMSYIVLKADRVTSPRF